MKRLISLVLVAALSFFSFMVYSAEAAYLVGTSSLSTSGSQPYTVGTILDRSVVYPSLLTTDVVSYQPYNLFNLKDIGYSSYSRVTSVSGYSNLFLYDYVATNLGSFTYSASGSGSLSYQLNPLNGDLSTPVSLVSFNSGTSARVVSNMSFTFPSDVPCLESGVEYSFYFLVDHIGVDNFSISPVWQDTVSISDLVYNVNSSFDNVYGRIVVNSSDSYLSLSGLKMSFDCNWSVSSQGSQSIKRLYGFSFWRTSDDDDDIIAAINEQTNLMNQQYQDTENKFQGAVNSGQAGANQEIQDNVGQLEDFDNKIFTDVSDYTSQLDFGLGDWSEAAAGISYIGSIFMLIWDNSPTQVIVLSLMVGLCLLILGRGPRVAGEVRRHEERASRRKKGG